MFSAKTPLKIFKPLHEVKLLMFSKENSLGDIYFTQPPQKEDRAMIPSLIKADEISQEKIKQSFYMIKYQHKGRLVNIISCLRWNRDQFYYCSAS